MPTIFWALIFVIVLMLAGALGLSFYFTRRSYLGEVHTPDEYGMQYEPVEFKATDGIVLRGVWIPSEGSDKAVLFLHGHDSSHDFDVYLSPSLHDAGFSLLFFDFRAHGRSEGKRKNFGYEERRDVLGAIDFLKKTRNATHWGVWDFLWRADSHTHHTYLPGYRSSNIRWRFYSTNDRRSRLGNGTQLAFMADQTNGVAVLQHDLH